MIGPKGRVEIPTTELLPGTRAEILVLPVATELPKALTPEEREATLQRMEELREQAISEGMQLWDVDRINAEVAERRGGTV